MDTEAEVDEDTFEGEVPLQILLVMMILEVLEGLLMWVPLALER
jgi:hypothetical protein